MEEEDYCLKCPSCGAQSNVDPALLSHDAPMPYCKECDQPLITDAFIKKHQPERKEETQNELWKEALSDYSTITTKFRIERIK